VNIVLKKWFVALLIAQFGCLQMLVAMHRAAHLPAHEMTHATTLHGESLLHAVHLHDDHKHFHNESATHNGFGIFADHQSKTDCDRLDACSGGDIVVARLNDAQFAAPETTPLSRIDVAYVATRNFRATARAPPAPT
jgi:hypothetical protein